MRVISLFSLLFVLVFPCVALGGGYEIQDLVAQQDGNGAIVVQGVVRNMGKDPLQGHVVVQFLKADGVVVHAVETPLNEGRSLFPGEAAGFEMVARTEGYDSFEQVSVDFVEEKTR
ncbi:MAG: hypothetical protein JRF59_14735 [Deltaproteobacteria bacterium]|nr:hypothetical protein [Deltaproteobacteria bacterium]MBW1923641.1 hypothetical protein [Deltaproteobacteria bacterium]MBW1948602.1 hypothetical protein [Deltaproteobacteria bacterium]MBW2007948.1 hypothetical protein [Deltaproteobacteria bacterium]MBW2349072.1 hypothetical protein [Deltaproteobacteria bacterium]